MKKNLHLPGLLCILASVLAPLALAAADRMAYIKHSSGLILGNSNNRAVILDRNDDRAVPALIRETADGWVNIVVAGADGASLYLCKTGSWNTSFTDSGTADEAQFRIEGEDDGYVRLLCKANNRYLGTDENNAGSNVYSDKDGGDIKHQWFVAENPDSEPNLAVTRYDIDASNLLQTTEGWGVSLCWWANMCGRWSDKQIDRIITWLVSPTGLNYNIFRYNIGGGDDPDNANCTPHHMGSGKGLRAEMEGFKDFSGDVYHWERDAAQRKIMLAIKEKRPDAIFEAFSNTPPWYMTVSGCCSGHEDGAQDNLRPECYEEFARYLVDVCVHYRDEYGIEFRTLEPFNESNSSYWHRSGVQEGCHFEFDSQVKLIKILYPMLKESGLSTVIAASDETAVWPALFGFYAYRDAGILDMVGQWNTHTYWGTNDDRINYNKLVRPTGARLWMSETGSGGNGLSGNLSMAQRLIDDIRYLQPDAWLDWQYIEENNDQWCTVQAVFETEYVRKTKNYFVRQHFSKFIKAGYTFVGTDDEQTIVALSPAADTLVVATVNNMPLEKTYVATLRNFHPGSDFKMYLTDGNSSLARVYNAEIDATGKLTYTMPATSIVTLVIPCAETGIADVETVPVQWHVEGGTLHVDCDHSCRVDIYTPSGALVYSGAAPAAVALQQGYYLLSVTDGLRRTAATVAVDR